MTQPDSADEIELGSYALSDRYKKDTGRVFLTGTQAIARIAFDQARRDRAAGATSRVSSQATAVRRSAASIRSSGAQRTC
jgi:hypothetical protein